VESQNYTNALKAKSVCLRQIVRKKSPLIDVEILETIYNKMPGVSLMIIQIELLFY
jgi:hypothetical protein